MIGENIKKMRKYRHMSQKQLAVSCGFHVNTIQQYEAGKREPSEERLSLIAKKLDLDIYCLYTGISPEEADGLYMDGIRAPEIVHIVQFPPQKDSVDFSDFIEAQKYRDLTHDLTKNDLISLRSFADFLRSQHSTTEKETDFVKNGTLSGDNSEKV